MKLVTLSLTLILTMLASSIVSATPTSKKVMINVSSIYVDDVNDKAKEVPVVLSGLFPNGCYSWSNATIKHLDNVHEISSYANVNSGMCIMVMVPFTQKISLGVMNPGVHTLVFHNGDDTYQEKTITVK